MRAMHWTRTEAESDFPIGLEKRLSDPAKKLRADSVLKPSEFSPIDLNFIFLRYSETRFMAAEKEMGQANHTTGEPTSCLKIGPSEFHTKGASNPCPKFAACANGRCCQHGE
jgi:hypothetical protein